MHRLIAFSLILACAGCDAITGSGDVLTISVQGDVTTEASGGRVGVQETGVAPPFNGYFLELRSDDLRIDMVIPGPIVSGTIPLTQAGGQDGAVTMFVGSGASARLFVATSGELVVAVDGDRVTGRFAFAAYQGHPQPDSGGTQIQVTGQFEGSK